jgi:hypothetical protein
MAWNLIRHGDNFTFTLHYLMKIGSLIHPREDAVEQSWTFFFYFLQNSHCGTQGLCFIDYVEIAVWSLFRH